MDIRGCGLLLVTSSTALLVCGWDRRYSSSALGGNLCLNLIKTAIPTTHVLPLPRSG